MIIRKMLIHSPTAALSSAIQLWRKNSSLGFYEEKTNYENCNQKASLNDEVKVGCVCEMTHLDFFFSTISERYLMEFKREQFAGPWRTLTWFSASQFFVTRVECFGSLSCIKVQLLANLSWVWGNIISDNKLQYVAAVCIPLAKYTGPTIPRGKQDHIIWDPSSCFTIGIWRMITDSICALLRIFQC